SVMRAEWSNAVEAAERTMKLAAAGSDRWLQATCGALFSAVFLGAPDVAAKAAAAIVGANDCALLLPGYGLAIYMSTLGLWYIDQLDHAAALVNRAQDSAAKTPDLDPAFDMWLDCSRGLIQLMQGQLGSGLNLIVRSLATAERLGSGVGRAVAASNLVVALSATGHFRRTLAGARIAFEAADSMGMRVMNDHVELCVAIAAVGGDASATEIAKARAPLHRLLDKRDTTVRTSAVRTTLACLALDEGKWEQAKGYAEVALQEAQFASAQADALGVLALVELCLERPHPALAHTERAFALMKTSGVPRTRSILHLVRARAFHGLGKMREAESEIRVAREHVVASAATLEDIELREAYLRIAAHRSILRLAAQWLGEGGAQVDATPHPVYG
ncbi:MAG TPA: hypothetical protein VJR89_37550, partial [Polyangiales bacterium]|nr:hypothetical protein [Polyangiales bacterium]